MGKGWAGMLGCDLLTWNFEITFVHLPRGIATIFWLKVGSFIPGFPRVWGLGRVLNQLRLKPRISLAGIQSLSAREK
jgi:hypothetical protein